MKVCDHADNLNQLLVKEREFLSVFSIEENLEPAGYVAVYHTLQFITLLFEILEMFHDPGDVRVTLSKTKERTPTCSDL